VVLERSVFSDSVIGQALFENNMLSDEAYKFYMRGLVPDTIRELWRPHVSIFLDKSPEDCLKTIREKGKVRTVLFFFVQRITVRVFLL
jgi:deoxyadenosine/deoxycytidine kinase